MIFPDLKREVIDGKVYLRGADGRVFGPLEPAEPARGDSHDGESFWRGKAFEKIVAAYGINNLEPTVWQLGPLIPGSWAHDAMPTQLVDAPGHAAKIEIHGDYCDAIGRQIVKAMLDHDRIDASSPIDPPREPSRD